MTSGTFYQSGVNDASYRFFGNKQMYKQRRGHEEYNTVAYMASVLIHGVLKSTEIGGNPCKGEKKASILADAILIK